MTAARLRSAIRAAMAQALNCPRLVSAGNRQRSHRARRTDDVAILSFGAHLAEKPEEPLI